MSASESVSAIAAGAPSVSRERVLLHRAWQVGACLTIATGLFHLFNLVAPGRLMVGPAMLTPFRIAFAASWLILIATFIRERRWPRLENIDYLVAVVVAVFIFRGLFHPESLSTVANWIITGAGVFYLIRHGIRDSNDVRLILVAIGASALVIALYGLIEYFVKSNPLFDSIQVDAIGIDSRIGASDQYYRIRSLVGHPGFVGAIVLGAIPVVMLVLWRRRWLLAGSLAIMAGALFLTFSRGSWLLAGAVLVPLLGFRARYWARRNLKWILPLAAIPIAVVAFDYFNRDEVSASLPGYAIQETGLYWTDAQDGPVTAMSGEANGIQPLNHFIYFHIEDSFFHGDHGPVTVVLHYFDRGTGNLHIEYDSWSANEQAKGDAYNVSMPITKTDTRQWTSAAFYLPDARFEGRENGGADFRIVDDDNLLTLDQVTVQKGRLTLPSVVAQQWISRTASISTRFSLYPFAWNVLKQNPLGVGLFNTPGTDGHAVDSLPLTWMMEFGWPGLALLLGLAGAFVYEGIRIWRIPRSSAAVLYVVLVLLILHGAHLMILYDKPSLVMIAAVAAVYSVIRPRRKGGRAIDADNENCMV